MEPLEAKISKIIWKEALNDWFKLSNVDVVACWNLLIKAYLGLEQRSHRLGRDNLDGRVVSLPSTAAHDPIAVKKPLWMRWNSLDKTTKTIQNDWNEHLGRNGGSQ